MRRIVKALWNLPPSLINVPHQNMAWCDRQTLLRIIDESELNLGFDRSLPADVVLLEKPKAEDLQALGHDAALLRYWRPLFHVHVLFEFVGRRPDGVSGHARVHK